MPQNITLAVLVGTTRPQRESIKAAKYVAEQAKVHSDIAEVVLVDPKDFNFPGDGNDPAGKDPRYSQITRRADAFFIVTPEYNHSFPGSLKRMLDSEYDNYRHKAVALAGCSNGMWGGVRVCEALLPVCHRLGLVNIQSELYFPKVQNIFDANGQILSELAPKYQKNIDKSLVELVWLAKLLKSGREQETEQ